MNPAFTGVSGATLRTLASALRSGRLPMPPSTFSVSAVARCSTTLVTELQRLASEGISREHLAMLLDTGAEAIDAQLAGAGVAELVWTGPEGSVAHSRDTAAVVEELFSRATRSVLVSSYTVQQENIVFRGLASRMEQLPDLSVQLFLHVAREWRDSRDESELLREFATTFARQWPGTRRPQIYYDPRTLSLDPSVRAAWHAKCLAVDDEVALITSANFTEWGHQRNVEAGVLVTNQHFVAQLRNQFDGLIRTQKLRRLPGY